VRRDIALEREQLAEAVEELRGGLAGVTDVGGKLRTNLPAAAAGAAGIGFVLAGGIGATMRYLARRGREGDEKARIGRFRLLQR
jgi:4-hydroxy-3-methylbut-2-en-1-yl diphosphate synthase IspG/GcpE